MRIKDELKKLLNLEYLEWTEQTYPIGEYDLPYIPCPPGLEIDYLATYSRPSEYFKTENTAVCFYEYDRVFDGIHGLFNAIYYNEKKLLDRYRNRFDGVRMFVAPDYSQCREIQAIENKYRLFRARIVSIWLIMNIEALVVPNLTYASEDYFDCMSDGMEDCSCFAVSLVGVLDEDEQKALLKKALPIALGKMKKVERIFVYNGAANDDCIQDLFGCALDKGIDVVVPGNRLKMMNSKE